MGTAKVRFFSQAPSIKPLFWRFCFMASMVYESNTKIEFWSNYNDMGKTEVFKEKSLSPLPIFFTTNITQIQIYVIL
jgi:hypothetical protein